jgi:hypothetical protein
MGMRQAEVLRAIMSGAVERLEDFNPQDLETTAGTFATPGVQPRELLGVSARRALVWLDEFSPQARRGPWSLGAGGRRSCRVRSRGGVW